ncbi:MAG: protein-glutamate O-methyltransferase [Pseudomonadota bacterium]
MQPAFQDHDGDEPISSDQTLTSEQFSRVAALVFSLTGIVLKEHKMQMVHARLMRRMRSLKIPRFEDYIALVESKNAGDEIEQFINAVTTNLTSFFREDHHFEHLESEILTPLANQGANRVRIWSAGCSTGEEPYSIAMTVLTGQPRSNWDLRILATDLDTNVLAHASAGLYRNDKTEAIPERYRKYTRQQADGLEMSAEAKRLITFRQLNLLETWPVSGPFDAIFCRNVMIYFEADTKADLVERFARLLAPHGALYLGHSESLLGTHPLLMRDGQTTYRRNF